MDDNAQAYSMATIRRLLLAAFTAKDLKHFCQDHPAFEPIVDRFGADFGKDDMVDEIIDYCRVQLLFDDLLTEVEKSNPRQYKRFAPLLRLGSPPTPASPVTCIGKVCALNSGWDRNTFFVREDHFHALGLPIGTRITVCVLDTGRRASDVTLSVDLGLSAGSVRMSKSLRDILGVADDIKTKPIRLRPERQFEIRATSGPRNPEAFTCRGKISRLRKGQRKSVVYLRNVEHREFRVPAGTMISLTALDTGRTVNRVTLGLDAELATCVIRLSRSLQEALGVADDTDIEPPDDRPERRFRIRVPKPSE
jgi:hypothetical protein